MRVKFLFAKRLIQDLTRLLKDESGATAIEYAMIAGLIFLVIITAITTYTQKTNQVYQRIGSAISTALG